MKIFSRIVCVIMGHVIDWDEYDLRMEKEGHYGASDMVQCKMCNKYIKVDVAAMDKIKVGDEVWYIEQNPPVKLMVQRLEKGYLYKGFDYKVVSGSIRADLTACYRSEIELINEQILYWKNLKFEYLEREQMPISQDEAQAIVDETQAKYRCSTHEN